MTAILALLKLVPLKDWLYCGAIAALLIGFGVFVHHERSVGAANELHSVQTASARVQAAADKKIADLTAQHAATVAAIQETQSVQLKAAAADSATLAGRLRDYEAGHSCPGPVLAGASAAPASSAAGAGGNSQTQGGPGAVESDLEALIAAAEHDTAVVNAERSERDSLTGK